MSRKRLSARSGHAAFRDPGLPEPGRDPLRDQGIDSFVFPTRLVRDRHGGGLKTETEFKKENL